MAYCAKQYTVCAYTMCLEEVLLSVLYVVDLFSEARHLSSNRAFFNLQGVLNIKN